MEQPEQAPEPMGITPYLTAILLCDQVIQDATTKKVTLVGVFDRAYVPAFPGGVAATLFARLTDAEGVYQFRIEHVYIPTNRVLGTADVPAQTITDRLQHVQLVLAMGLQVDEPGPYEIRLSANEAYLGRAPLEVLAAPAHGGLPHGD